MLEDKYWKFIFGASLAILGFQIYRDYKDST